MSSMFQNNKKPPASWQVPDYDVEEICPRRSPHAVFVFVINEGKRVQAQLRQMLALTPAIDVIVADGGSTDGSMATMQFDQTTHNR